MNDLDFLAPLIQALGPAAATFGVMYLWLRYLMEQVKELTERLASQETQWQDRMKVWQERVDRLHETRATEQATTIAVLSQIKEAVRAVSMMPSNQGSYPQGTGGHPPTFTDDPSALGG